MSAKYRDYIVSDKGLFCVPDANAVISVKLWEEIIALAKQKPAHKKVEDYFIKNPTFLEELLLVDPFIQKLSKSSFKDDWSGLEEQWYKGFGGSFLHNLNNKVNERRSPDEDVILMNAEKWQHSNWVDISKNSPNLVSIIKKLYPFTQRGQKKISVIYNPSYGYHPPAFNTKETNLSLKLSLHLADGTYKLVASDASNQSSIQKQGSSVCIFVNKEKRFYTGRGLSQSIAGAKTYESLEAAKRSSRALTMLRNHDLTFVKVNISFEDILEATSAPALEMKQVKSLKQRDDISNELVERKHQLTPKKKKM